MTEERAGPQNYFKNINLEEILFKFRYPITLLLIGTIISGVGFFILKDKNLSSDKIEVLESATLPENAGSLLVVEIAGAVESPGVYKMAKESRIEDLLIASGGVSTDADRDWLEKYINRAAKLSDGQKIYIPVKGEKTLGEQSLGASANNEGGDQTISGERGSGFEKKVNINTASASELESLWGIGPVYAQNIIEHRPYSSVEELLEKKIIKSNVYERNKDLLTVY